MNLLWFIGAIFSYVDQTKWRVMRSDTDIAYDLYSGDYTGLYQFAASHPEYVIDLHGALSVCEDHITIWVEIPSVWKSAKEI